MVENRAVGIKSREVYEAPAAIALIEAHRSLEDLVLTKAELRIKRQLEVAWTELVYEGQWYNPARVAIDAFVDTTQALVDGDVRLLLQQGRRPSSAAGRRTRCMQRRSPRMRRARRSPTRRPRASSASHRSRPSSQPPGIARSPPRHDALVWPRARGARARGLGVPPRRRRRASSLRHRGDEDPRRAAPCRGTARRRRARGGQQRLSQIAQLTCCRRTRTSTRRSSVYSGRSAEGSTPDGRGTTR